MGGVTSGLLYVAETTAMLSYPKLEDRGFYLGIWSAMRNSGSVIGGAINFSKNHSDSKSGGVVWATYLIFLGFECTGVIWALLLSQTRKVRRRDHSKVSMSPLLTWKQEIVTLWTYLRNPNTWLVFIPAFYSFFYGGTMGTYLSLHFSVRARALSSLIVPCIVIPCVLAFGRLLDSTRIPQKRKAWIGFLIWVIPQGACFIWIALEYHYRGDKTGLDYTLNTRLWAQAYFPYLIIFVAGYLTQLCLYWILGNFSNVMGDASRAGGTFRAFEVAGQAVSYGLSSASHIDHTIPLYVNIGLLLITVPSMVLLINKMPTKPLSVVEQVVEEKEDAEKKA
ncbi:major facilitator superfamily transporter [Pyrenophora seminiperda CCB06]|uniref:Major facilitator superfamily transporter n=1 Tax=Pyrenophora seminiperda CCB06 TaxID=1302712 RepID=A0A3M7M9F2_9PLEO|nr:major facilitator superfamily transporter [Pyrenophora seminiperda CCB06]